MYMLRLYLYGVYYICTFYADIIYYPIILIINLFALLSLI